MKKHYYLLLVSMVFLICYSTELTAQDSPQTTPEFTIGAFLNSRTNQAVYNTFDRPV